MTDCYNITKLVMATLIVTKPGKLA